MGIHLDAAWRIYRGERPYVDFMWTVGPLHSYLSAFFFWLFGFGKTALLNHMIAVSSVAIVTIFFVSRRFVPAPVSWINAILAMTCFYWPWQIPWYTHTAQLWFILSAAILIVTTPFASRRSAGYTGFACGALTVLAFLTKPNIGVTQTSLVCLALLSTNFKRNSLSGYMMGLLACFLSCWLLFIPSIENFLAQTVLGYGANQAGRWGIFWHLPTLVWANYYWLVALPVFCNLPFYARNQRPLLAIFVGVWLCAILATFTSGALYWSDVQLMGLFGAVAAILLYRERSAGNNSPGLFWAIRKNALVSILIGLSALYAGYGLGTEAWAWNDVRLLITKKRFDPIGTYQLRSPPLEGWRCAPHQGQAVDGITSFLKINAKPDDRLLVLCDLFVLNSLTGLRSVPNITCGFTLGVWPVQGQPLEEVRKKIMSHPPEWIVVRRGYVPFLNGLIKYLGLQEFLVKHYGRRAEFNSYLVLQKIS